MNLYNCKVAIKTNLDGGRILQIGEGNFLRSIYLIVFMSEIGQLGRELSQNEILVQNSKY